jgi:hypothetical protein
MQSELVFILHSHLRSKSMARNSAKFRASFGLVFFTDCVITLNWLGFTATTRCPLSPATWSVGRSLAVNFAMSSSFHSFKYSRPFSSRRHAIKQSRCKSIALSTPKVSLWSLPPRDAWLIHTISFCRKLFAVVTFIAPVERISEWNLR